MVGRLVSSRGFMTALVTVVAGCLVAGGLYALKAPPKTISYCAVLSDSVGLYQHSSVTVRGVTVGKITGLDAVSSGVRVEFTVRDDHPLRGEVAAATVSDTIVADRRLAVQGTAGPAWPSSHCITRTATPKSISRTLNALTSMAGELNRPAPGQSDTPPIADALDQVNAATQNVGPLLNTSIKQFAAALKSPAQSINAIGSLIDSLSELMKSVAANWAGLRDTFRDLQALLEVVNEIWDQAMRIGEGLRVVFPLINDITSKYGGPILEVLDHSINLIDLAAANVDSLERLLQMIPAVDRAFERISDPATGRVRIAYSAPQVPIEGSVAGPVCAAVNAVKPQGCQRDSQGRIVSDLEALVLTMTGAST